MENKQNRYTFTLINQNAQQTLFICIFPCVFQPTYRQSTTTTAAAVTAAVMSPVQTLLAADVKILDGLHLQYDSTVLI